MAALGPKMPTRLDRDAIINALESIGCTDKSHQQYVGQLIHQDFVLKPEESLSEAAVRLHQLVASFLWDWKLVRSDAEAQRISLLLLARATNQDLPQEENDDYRSLKLADPMRIKDLVAQKFERQMASETSETTVSSAAKEVSNDAPVYSGGFEDPFLGMEKAQFGASSVVIPIEESMKIAKAAAKKRDKQLRMMRQWEKSKVPLPSPKRRHGDQDLKKLKDITVDQFSVAVAGRELLKDAALKLTLGHRYGLIGRNGIGKTTFLSALVRGEVPHIDKDINIACVEQECSEEQLQCTPIDCVLRVDEERSSLLAEAGRLQKVQGAESDDAIGQRLEWVFHRLAEIEADKAEAQACMILSGLGLSDHQIRRMTVKELSGGWRARVMLARVLFADPDILCLDEPTNHLDVHAVAWLTNFLAGSSSPNQSTRIMILVSHSRQFLNDVCTDIMDFKDRKLSYYPGNYDVFEAARAESLKHKKKAMEAQQGQREHIQKFIDRFRYNAKRAALVQSRIKALQKLPMIEEINDDPQLQFKFTPPSELPTPILVMQGVSFSYNKADQDESNLVLQNVDISADMETRIAICGVNGSGKSTLLKLLLGHLEPKEGFIFRHNKLKIGYFAQHHLDGLDLTKNAVQQLQSMYPDAKLSDLQARTFLGKFGITGLLALEPMFILSGGQKSRVAIACMAFDEPHILLMDEPTNHLDLDAIQALIAALNTFEGGVILVSHDSHLLSCVAEEVYHLDPRNRTLVKFKGDFEEYRQQVLKHKI